MLFIVLVAIVGAILAAIAISPVAGLIPLILGAIAANRMGYRHQGEATARAIAAQPSTTQVPTPPAESIAQRLEQLAGLRDRGLITPEEYETKKTDLLARF